jgi:hypothetical protein
MDTSDAGAVNSNRADKDRGGTVEPGGRKAQRAQGPRVPSERFELRDPFTESIYYTSSIDAMALHAERLGSHRFVAIDGEGTRSFVQKLGGQWQRLQRAVQRPEQAAEASVSRPSEAASSKPTNPAKESLPAATQRPESARQQAKDLRAAEVQRLESALQERYLITRPPRLPQLSAGYTEYRFRGEPTKIAFSASKFRLATDTNTPSVARSMVDVAQARNWQSLRVSGHEDFRRLVWLEASVRGVKTIGYEPTQPDLNLLKTEREARLVNRIESVREAAGEGSSALPADKASGRGGGGRKVVLAAIEAVLVARRSPEKQRAAIMASAAEQLPQRIREGREPMVKIFDRTAPQRGPEARPAPEMHQAREAIGPERTQ